MAYLDAHPPARPQFLDPRRDPVTGCVVLHSAENLPDLRPPDTGADAVAKFIQHRPDAGSYHTMCDSDSRLALVRYECEAFGDRTGSNRWGIHVSGAYRANEWHLLPRWFQSGVVEQMALAVRDAARWVETETGIVVPARILTRAESEAGKPGLISHALRDPKRRTDPNPVVLRAVTDLYADLIAKPTPPPTPNPGDDDMDAEDRAEIRKIVREELARADHEGRRLIWYKSSTVEGTHAYLVEDGQGVHVTLSELGTARKLRVAEGAGVLGGTSSAPLGDDFIGTVALLDGPLRNVG